MDLNSTAFHDALVYSEERSSIYLWHRSPKEHEWEPFKPYQDKYEHAWWRPVENVGTGEISWRPATVEPIRR